MLTYVFDVTSNLTSHFFKEITYEVNGHKEYSTVFRISIPISLNAAEHANRTRHLRWSWLWFDHANLANPLFGNSVFSTFCGRPQSCMVGLRPRYPISTYDTSILCNASVYCTHGTDYLKCPSEERHRLRKSASDGRLEIAALSCTGTDSQRGIV